LLGEPGAAPVRAGLGEAELVLASDLTVIECRRALIRASAAGALPEATAQKRRAHLRRTLEHWILFRLEEEIVERASRAFPLEPIRTLDAIHLATALLAQSLVPDLALLSLDDRVRENGARMGFRLLPETVRRR
jgi:predicted nucleic acid-binding protein